MSYRRQNRHDDEHDDHGGLHRDLSATGAAIGRREVLRRFAFGSGALVLLGCRGAGASTGPESCARIPTETAGPFPGDGSNGANVLDQTGVVRTDIRSSFAGLSGMATGVPLTIELTLVAASTCDVLAGRAVYLWHCDAVGRYSLYTSGVTNQNWLRGVQEADANGVVTFTSIYPGCYPGRWPHIHFEVYPTLASSASVANRIATSQIALPKAASDLAYATSGYGNSASSAAQISLSADSVFRDGSALELATVTGSVSSGFVASLTVAV